MNAGYAKQKANTKYISKKAAPPLLAACVGKPQILPSPTAEPAAAIIKPKLELKTPRIAAIMLFLPLYIYTLS